MEDAVTRFLAATEANDMAALEATLAPGARLPSPIFGRATFKGRADVTGVLRIVYAMLRDVRWEEPIRDGRRQTAVASARLGGFRIGDAMVFELDEDGLIVAVRPHLRPLLATIVFFLMIGPRVAPRPGLLIRALRR